MRTCLSLVSMALLVAACGGGPKPTRTRRGPDRRRHGICHGARSGA